MAFSTDRLLELLPAYDRVRDLESGQALEALLAIVAETVAALEEDLAQLYDDQFIETCAEWAVPYLADLIGYRTLPGTTPTVSSPRAEVADTIGFRRRKGTAAMLEQVARDVTGWDARVVEFFRLIGWTQHVQHVRPGAGGLASLRSARALEELGGAFDPFPHTVDVRRIARGRGRYNIPDVGIFLWRLRAFPVTDVPAAPVQGDPLRFRFSPLGNDTRLVNQPEAEVEVTHLAEPVNVPGPLRRRELAAQLADYWGRAIGLTVNGRPVPDPDVPGQTVSDRVAICNLDDDPNTPGGWAHQPDAKIALDPVLGRLAFPTDQKPDTVRVTYHYGFSAELGGGEYEREDSFDGPLLGQSARRISVPGDGHSPDLRRPTVGAAFAALGDQNGVIELTTNDPQQLADPIVLAAGQRVELRAENGRRTLLALSGALTVEGGADSELTLNGFLIAGGGLRVGGRLGRLTVRHCTLVPGHTLTESGEPGRPDLPSIVVTPDAAALLFRLEIDHTIAGALRLPDLPGELVVNASIVDAGTANRAVHTRTLLSGPLTPFPALTSPTPRIAVTVGEDGPHNAVLPAVPAGLGDAAVALQAAVRGVGLGPAFTAARVTIVDDRLVVLSGTGERVTFEPAGPDPTATELKLDAAGGRPAAGLLGAPLPDPPVVRSEALELNLRIGSTVVAVAAGAAPVDLARLAGQLQAGIRAADADPAFAAALVGLAENRLLVLPGTEDAEVAAGPADGDETTVHDLGLALRPAIGSGRSGAEPGPATTVQRSTLVGPVFVRELTLGTESIFTDGVWTERRQVGCVRFSYLTPGSRTPRRHRCQPASSRDANRIRPSFTTLRYGRAGYGQLGAGAPAEITAGAEDEAEMGVFHDLHQHQRVTNLRLRLEEYLRFGLEAGVVFES